VAWPEGSAADVTAAYHDGYRGHPRRPDGADDVGIGHREDKSVAPDVLIGVVTLVVGALSGWWIRGQTEPQYVARPAVALALLPASELLDITPPHRKALDEAVAALRLAESRIDEVQDSIRRATTGFAQASLDRHTPNESDRTLAEARRDIGHAIGSLADRSSLTPEAIERIESRYE
jgi:hypothetical protein